MTSFWRRKLYIDNITSLQKERVFAGRPTERRVASVIITRLPIGAIAKGSQAPTGSIYHRFGSLQELLARLWIRAVRRAQEAALRGLENEDAVSAAVEGALGTYDFCLAHPKDARLLAQFRREDFVASDLPPELYRELEALNEAGDSNGEAAHQADLRPRRSGRDGPRAVRRRRPALQFARRYLESGDRPSAALRAALAIAVRAMLTERQG
jgi:AcrR family transcriptional regulator